jgi:hypothetical protein
MKFKKSFFVAALVAELFSSKANAQLDNDILRNDLSINAADSNKLLFGLNTLNFLRNTEYFGPIEFGKTWFGYSLVPKLTYYPSSNVRIDAGGVFTKDFGNNQYRIAAPIFTVKISKNGYSGIFGNLEGAMSHRYIEPLYNIEYAVSKPLENGLQFKIDKKRFFSDTWIDWQRMIYYGSPFKEEISAGTSNMLTLIGVDKKFRIAVPYQAVVHHFGGQIDTLRSLPLSTEINMASGLRLSYHFSDSSFFKELRSDNYYVLFTDESHVKKHAYSSGDGWYFNLLLKMRYVSLMASYWQGNKYLNPNGTYIYQSANTVDAGQALKRVPNRNLFFMRLFFEKQIIKNLNFEARLEPLYDFSRDMVDFSYSVYLRYNLNVKLTTIKLND